MFASGWLPAARAQELAGHVVLVLPFENRSGNPTLNWIGDSFPDTLNKRLSSAGFLTISHDDRAFALDHLGLPAGFRPSRATTIRIAQQLDANYVVIGSYNVSNDHIAIQAQSLSIDQLKLSAAARRWCGLEPLVRRRKRHRLESFPQHRSQLQRRRTDLLGSAWSGSAAGV